jgi:hypothetical protein
VFDLSQSLLGGFIMRTLLTRLAIVLGMVTTTATVTVIESATANALIASNHNEVMASG